MNRPIGPALELVEENKRWTIMIRNAKVVEDALGRDVLLGFARCFVHADRLTSTISAIYASQQLHGRDSIAFGRDLHSLVWFTIGTLRELAPAIQEVRAALAKRRMFDAQSAPWIKLREFETRWEDDESFRRMRDKAAFHVDTDIIDKGVDELVMERDVELSRGEGQKSVNASLTLGYMALFHGLGMNLEDYRRFLETVSDDHGIAETIQAAFILAAQRAGVSGIKEN